MEKDNFEARTIEELPTHPSNYMRCRFKKTCLNLATTNFRCLGFVIYRCTYDDDDLWSRYISQLKENWHQQLVKARRAELLWQYVDLVIVEDRHSLDNASKADVRSKFQQWVAQHRPAPDEYPNITQTVTRFTHCLYVDKQCLETVKRFQEVEVEPLFVELRPPMVFAVIDRSWTPDRVDGNITMNDEGYPPIDGCDRKYVGWKYHNAFYIADLYEALQCSGLDDYLSYRRPPAVSPGGKDFMTI